MSAGNWVTAGAIFYAGAGLWCRALSGGACRRKGTHRPAPAIVMAAASLGNLPDASRSFPFPHDRHAELHR